MTVNLAEFIRNAHGLGCSLIDYVTTNPCTCDHATALRRAELLEEYYLRANKVIIESSFYKFDGDDMAALQKVEAALAKEEP